MSNFGDSEAEEDSLDESLSNKSDDEEEEDEEGEEDGQEIINDDANDIINDEEEEEEEEEEAHHHHRKRRKGTISPLSCPQSFLQSILYCVEAYSAVLIKLTVIVIVTGEHEDDLDEEDLSLIEENLGISIKRVRKLTIVNLC